MSRRLVRLPVAVAAIAVLGFSAATAQEAPADPVYTLERALETALDRNFSIRQAKERIRQQSGVVLEAQGTLLPHVDGSAAYNRVDEDKLPELNGQPLGDDETWVARVEATQPLFLGGGGVMDVRRARFAKKAAVAAFKAVVNDVMFMVREQFYLVLLNTERVFVREEAVRLLEEELASQSRKRDAGIVSDFNVLRAEVALANERTPLIRARNDLILSIESLYRLMGLPPRERVTDPSIEVAGDLSVELTRYDLESVLASALANRPELGQLAALRDAAASGVWIARSDYLPSISAYAAYEEATSPFSADSDETEKGWEAGFRGSWNVFNGFGTVGRVRQEKSERALADIDLEEARLTIEIEARRAFFTLQEAEQLLAASEKVVEQAAESLRLARARFDAGVATQLDVLDSQVALTEARSNQAEASYGYNVAVARLRRAVGAFVEP